MMLLWFVMGAVMGSAANAVIDRLPRRESWIRGRSRCDKCRHILGTWDLIPIVSYLALEGGCRHCHSPIPSRNLLVEVGMGAGFVVLAPQWMLMAILWVTVIIAVMDWETQLVSELLVVVWGVLIIADQFLISNSLIDLNNLWGAAMGVGVIGGIWAVTRGRAMGFGDVEMALVMGLWLGWPKMAMGLWAAFVTGAIVGLVKLVQRQAGLKSQIAFGPFLVIGAWAAYFWGDMIVTWLFPY